MRINENELLKLSASDLMRHMACPHATVLELQHLRGEGPVPGEDSADAALLQRYGDAHEALYLENLKADRQVIEIPIQSFDNAVLATREELSKGPDILYQGALEGGIWGGWSDFLERVETPSAFGNYSYEVIDTKLKRKEAPGHVLQLALYSDLLSNLQEKMPVYAHIVLGTGRRFSFRLSEYVAYTDA